MRYLYARTRNALGKIAEYGNARRDPFAPDPFAPTPLLIGRTIG